MGKKRGILIQGMDVSTGLAEDSSWDPFASGLGGSRRNFPEDDGAAERTVVLTVTGQEQWGAGVGAFDPLAMGYPLFVEFFLKIKKPLRLGREFQGLLSVVKSSSPGTFFPSEGNVKRLGERDLGMSHIIRSKTKEKDDGEQDSCLWVGRRILDESKKFLVIGFIYDAQFTVRSRGKDGGRGVGEAHAF